MKTDLPQSQKRHRTSSRLPTAAWRCAFVLVSFWALASVGPVHAQNRTQTLGPQVPDFIAQALPQAIALARQAASVQAPPQARVVVEAGQLDPRLTLAPCGRVEVALLPGVPAWGRTRVGLRCTDGQTRWSVSLPMTVQVWAAGVVPRTDLPAGTRLGPEHLTKTEIDWAAGAGGAFDKTELLTGRTLARPIAAGLALRQVDLQTRQWFARGDTVQVQVAGSGFAIVADGQALSPGLEGQPVRVRMGGAAGGESSSSDGGANSGRIVVGKPVGERRVEIQL